MGSTSGQTSLGWIRGRPFRMAGGISGIFPGMVFRDSESGSILVTQMS
jgi:hypothetical protein